MRIRKESLLSLVIVGVNSVGIPERRSGEHRRLGCGEGGVRGRAIHLAPGEAWGGDYTPSPEKK